MIAARNIIMRYGAVTALDDVSLEVRAGSVHCLLGGNGAGKSTLIRIISGVLQPTSGSVAITGQSATVYQDLALVPLMSVWRNFVLGDEPVGRFGSLDLRAARERTGEGLRMFDLQLDLERAVAGLSGGQRQILAIARAVSRGAQAIILDEPTAALAVDQAERVLEAIRGAKARGCAVLFVTHNPGHALAVADWITVLRRGRVLLSAPSLNYDELSAAVAS